MGLVAKIIVDRPVPVVRARFGDDVDDSAERSTVFRSKTVVHHAEFADGFLGRRGPLGSGHSVDIIRAVHRDDIAQVAHAAEGDSGHLKFREGGLQARPAATAGVNSAKSVKSRPLMGKDSIWRLSTTWLISVRVGSIGRASPVTVTSPPTLATLKTTLTVAVWPTLNATPVWVKLAKPA